MKKARKKQNVFSKKKSKNVKKKKNSPIKNAKRGKCGVTEGSNGDAKNHKFAEEISCFVHSIEGLQQTLRVVMHIVEYAYKKTEKSFCEFVKDNCIKKDSKSDEPEYMIPFEKIYETKQMERKFKGLELSYMLIPSSFVISLVSQYDAYIGKIAKLVYMRRPELISKTEKQIALNDVICFSTIDDIKEHIVEKEIESLLRLSHREQLKRLEKSFNVVLQPHEELLKKFIEVTERRNLFVHCNGIVSSQYINNCKQNNIVVDEEVCVGDKLIVTPDYFQMAFETIYEIGVTLVHALWRKLFSEELVLAEDNIVEISFNLLCSEMNTLAETIANYGFSGVPKNHSEHYRRMHIINKAIAMKFQDNSDYLSDINNEDWTAVDNKFKLAIYVLKEDWEKAIKVMKDIGQSGAVKKEDYIHWPLFRQFREIDLFSQEYEKIFNEKFAPFERKYDFSLFSSKSTPK